MTNPTTRIRKPMMPLRVLVTCSLLVAMSFALSWIKMFQMPQGGSITAFSMLPIMMAGYLFGIVPGLLSGLAYSLLQMMQDFYVVHPAQFLLDYIFAFTVLGLTAIVGIAYRKINSTPKSDKSIGRFIGGYFLLPLAFFFAGTLRFIMHTVSGAIFFASYAPAGVNPWVYSFIYNGSYMGVEIGLCVGFLLFPVTGIPFNMLINTLFKQVRTWQQPKRPIANV